MKKAVILVVSLFLLVTSASIVCGASSNQNLLTNSNFELATANQPDNWRADSWQPDTTLSVTTKKAHQGKYALIIDSTKVANDARMLQTVTVKPNTYYKLSGWVATENVTPDKIGANLCVMTNTFTNSSPLNNTVDWTYLELNFRTNSKDTTVAVGPRLGMWGNEVSGIAYYDDLSLVEMDSAPAGFQTIPEPQAQANTNTNTNTSGKSSFPVIGLIVVLIIIVLVVVFILYRKKKNSAKAEEDTTDTTDETDTADSAESSEEGKDDGNDIQES